MPKDDDKLDSKIFSKLLEIQSSVIELKTHHGTIKEDVGELKGIISNIRTDVNKNTVDLAEHIQGVQTNKERLNIEIQNRKLAVANIELRLKSVEFFPTLISHLKISLIWLGSISIALGAILKLFGFM